MRAIRLSGAIGALVMAGVLMISGQAWAVAADKLPRYEKQECWFPVPKGQKAECGFMTVEENHAQPNGRTVRLPVVVINTLDPADEKSRLRYEKTLSNIQEVRARDGIVVAIVTEGDQDTREMASYMIEVPPSSELLSPVLSVLPLQLLAYHIAVRRGCDVDQPRNLAKSVTVE